jgi:branched-chain amino acid transport system substrate-binding protein
LGFIGTISGVYGQFGKDVLLGGQIAVDQINAQGGLGGRKLELVVRDDQGAPPQGLVAAKEHYGQGINLLLGLVSTPVSLAVLPSLGEANAIMISSAAIADNLTHEAWVPNYFRATGAAYMWYRSLAHMLAQRAPDVTQWASTYADYVTGRNNAAEWASGMKEYYPKFAGKSVTIEDPVLTKFGQTDYKNEVVQLTQRKATGLYNGQAGTDAVTFWQQARSFGLADHFKVIADTGNDITLAKALRTDIVPMWTISHWYYKAHLDNKLGKALTDEYIARTKDQRPSGYIANAFTSVYAYATAIQKAGGATDTATLLNILPGLTFDTPKGPTTFRKEDHQAIATIDFIHLVPAKNADGWDVDDYVGVDGAEVIEPPSPGKALEIKS